ncbi:MAG: GntR family transcriptional regulator [Lachnospiraceae bacterium]|nr:GntR family transcriptional regulator [Lachnospiraceae bacterium]
MNEKRTYKNHSESLPLYVQVKEDIKDKIISSYYPKNSYLPSEFKLMDEYGVSRPTIRQAIRDLCQENYLEKKRGIGTLVKGKPFEFRNLNDLMNFNEEARTNCSTYSTRVLHFDIVQNNSILSEVFGPSEQDFFSIKRLRTINQQSAELVTTYIPKVLIPNLQDFDLEEHSLFDIMKKESGIETSYAEKMFWAINASAEDAHLLQIPENTAIQFVKTITYDTSGQPIEFSLAKDTNAFSNFKIIATRRNG